MLPTYCSVVFLGSWVETEGSFVSAEFINGFEFWISMEDGLCRVSEIVPSLNFILQIFPSSYQNIRVIEFRLNE